MLTMKELSQFIFGYIKSSGFDLNTIRIRISQGTDLDRVLQHGSTRMGLNPNKEWEQQDLYNIKTKTNYKFKHQDIIIASTIEDILEDAKLEAQGTLYHKLSIYENPFLTFYDGTKMKELMSENGKKDTQNQGRHYLFTVEDKIDAVLGLAAININNLMTGALTNISGSIKNLRLERFPRFYLTITNFCNRSCPFCCCSSGPTKKTFLSFDKFTELLAMEEQYEVQFEGGEPLLHPDFWKMVDFCLTDDKCKLIVICTNSVLIPFYNKNKLIEWLTKFSKKPFLLKPSYNSYLISKDKNLLSKLQMLKNSWEEIKWKDGSALVINARRDQMKPDKEQWITTELKNANLLSNANVFFYQKMGLAKDDEYIEPVIVQNHMKFYLIAPDGTNWATGLTERGTYMETME